MDFVREFAIFLADRQIIRFGEFDLSGGAKSPYYVDLRMIFGDGIWFRKTVKRMAQVIYDDIGRDSFEMLGAVPTGGLALGSALAFELVKPFLYVRAQPKPHGTGRQIEGAVPQDGSRCVMIDDVVTSGGSILDAVGPLAEQGLAVSHAFVVLDRREGAAQRLAERDIKLHSLVDIVQVSDILRKNDLIADDTWHQIRDRTV